MRESAAVKPTGLNVGIIKGTVTIPGVSGQVLNLELLVRALDTDVNANILSTPTLLTLDNQEANIVVGQNVPISMGYSPGGSLLTQAAASVAGSGVNASDLSSAIGGLGGVRYKRQDVGITLKITPHINDASQVRLEIDIEATAIKSVDPLAGPCLSGTITVDGVELMALRSVDYPPHMPAIHRAS